MEPRATQTVATEQEVDGRRAILVRPVEEGPWPGVVMLHEAWGIDDVLARQATRLAAAGYLVLAPDLLGDGPWLGCIRRTTRAIRDGHGRPYEIIAKAHHWLSAAPGCTGQIGVIGFCMGGGFALLLANRGFDAASVNYGPFPPDLDAAIDGACPMVASYGERDPLFKQVPRLREALESYDVPHDLKTYPTAGHSFLNDAVNGPRLFRWMFPVFHVGPDPLAAADAWRRIEAFFAAHLSPSSASAGQR